MLNRVKLVGREVMTSTYTNIV